MALQVLFMNIYVAWYHIEMGENGGDISDSEDEDDRVDMQIDNSAWMDTIGSMFGSVASGFDMTGMSAANAVSSHIRNAKSKYN